MVYENIVRLCKEQKISIAQLERSCKLGNGVVSGWKNGQPRLDSAKSVADYFGVTVDELMKEPAENE